MGATTASWLLKIETATEEYLLKARSSLREDLFALYQEKRVLDEQLARIRLDMNFIETNLSAINQRMDDKPLADENFDKHKHLAVTDHAVLRYMERMLGFNVEGIKRDIINGFPSKIPVGASCIKTGKTLYKLVTDRDRKVIVTIIKKR